MYILAIDQGTTSTRVVLYDNLFQAIITTQKSLPQIYPAKGHIEHDPELIFADVVYLLNQNIELSCAKLNTDKQTLLKAIKTVGITNQRETIVAWDKKSYKPIHNAIVWQDRRTSDFCNNLVMNSSSLEQEIISKTGLVVDPYFSASKIHWLFEKYNLYNNTNVLVGTIDSYLIYRLTSGQSHVTDITNASRTQLYNINTLEWDKNLLELYNLPGFILPEVKNCTDHFGIIDKSIIGQELCITGVAGDQQAAAIGQFCTNAEDMKITYGTGAFLLQNTGSKKIISKNKLLTTIAYKINDKLSYALEGSIFVAGATVQWLRDEMNIIKQAHDTETIASKLDSQNGTNGVYLIPALTGLGAPYWQPDAKAAIVGITRDTSSDHIVRAGLESVCYQTRDLLNAFEQDYGVAHHLKVDGGMTVNNWLLQFLADITRKDIFKPSDIESTVKGAAVLASIGCGMYKSLDEIADKFEQYTCFKPMLDINTSNELYSNWQTAVNRVIS